MNSHSGGVFRILRSLATCIAVVGIMASVAEARADEPPATTPLTRAIRIEDFAAATRNITRELVNQPDLGGYHPVTYAAYTRNPQLVKALLDGGADPNKVEHDGSTALSVAACLNQPEIIRILHQAGAGYPTGDKVTPPIANAIRADAVESLKTLLELYPALNINAGWPWPKDYWDSLPNNGADEVNPLFSRSALIFSVAAGHDEIARLLLGHGADLSKRTNYGLNALHYAVQNRRISSETVAALVHAGMDPVAPSYQEHYKPSTPLELASAEGSLAKLTILAEKLDARSHSESLRRAALIGSAYGHGEIVGFLYRKIGEEPPTLKRFIQKHPDPRLNIEVAGADIPLPAGDISAPMPASHPQTDGAGQRPGSIAVIASAALQNHAAMLTQELSDLDGPVVVDRDDIDHVAEEKLLGQFGSGKPSNKALDLDLIPASQLVVLEDLMVSDRKFIKATLVSTSSRIVELRMVLEFSDANETWVETKLAALLDTIHRVRERGPGSVVLSLIPLTPATPSQECMELSRYANLLLPAKALHQPGAVLLNLQQMRHLDAENAIAGKESYWKAAWVIEGTVSLHSPNSVRLVLGATPTGQGDRVEVTAEGDSELLAGALDRAWNELAAKLSLAGAAEDARPDKKAGAVDEAKVLAQQARWFVDAGYPKDAYDLASAAFLLGERNEDLLRTMTEAAIDRLPVLRNQCDDPVRHDPCVLEPAIRFRMTSAIPDYLTLCDSARLYVAKLNKRLVSRMRGTKGYSGRSESYNDVVSHALSELYFFRRMLNDCIIEAGHRNELRNLDEQIDSLTKEFMTKCKNDEFELITLGPLAFPSSVRFPIMHNPELRKRILDRMVDLATSEDSEISAYVVDRLFKWYNARIGTYRGPDPYLTIAETLLSSPVLRRQRPDLVEQLRAVSTTDTGDRVTSLRQILELAARPGTTFNYFGFDNREWERFLAGSWPVSRLQIFVESRLLDGGPGGLILNPGEGFEKTGECARLAGWYLGILKWSAMEPGRLEKELKLQADQITRSPEDKRPRASDIQGCRMLLKSINRLTPGIGRILDLLAPTESGRADISGTNESLKLQPLLSLPPSPGQSQFARWTQASLDGDQLWLPVTYFDRPAYLWKMRVHSDETNPRRNAIHVIDLADRKIRTVMLPDEVPEVQVDYHFGPPQSFGDPKVILGTKHAYFLTRLNPSGFLYAIDRQTLVIKRVKLPMPHVIAISACTRGDRLYVSIGEGSLNEANKGRSAASAVIAIEGMEIKETIVSNQRKPPQTPLDDPLTWVDLIAVNDAEMVLISNKQKSYMDPESYQGATYDWVREVWEKYSKQELDQARKQIREDFTNRFRGDRHVLFNKKTAYFAEDVIRGGIPASLVLIDDPSRAQYHADWLKNRVKSGEIRHIPVSADPRDGEAQMERHMYLLDEKNPQNVTRSANQMIQAAAYDASVCCKWRDQFLVFLTYRGVAMPAIWTAPESEIQRLAQPSETK